MLRSLAIQFVVFFAIFQGASMLRETSMLPRSTELSEQAPVLPTLMDETISLKSQGKKTVLYFFAPWCTICHASISNLQNIYQDNDDLDVIAVALDYANAQEIAEFSAQHRLDFPIALGNEQVKAQFKVQGYPSYYVIDEQNMITAKSMGYSSELGLYLRAL
ncbi:TlpA disulfide reductase family protein [Thalassomonas sp. RHCl1]|uniref:TlpA disulfide reductase family protein n=1 Tax=Thalassomonas sp. RHCl1 TaxID=2995320 RepID=UPI00248CC2CC|nr:TlpA disulfide reductase family protein [Thalassomonas sp. RHCl1]